MSANPITPESISDFRPGRLWSLWDMLKASAEEYILLGMDYQEILTVYGFVETAAQHDANAEDAKLKPGELENIRTHLKHLIGVCEKLGMPVSREVINGCLADPPATKGAFDLLWRVVVAELRSKLFLFVPAHHARYFEAYDLLSSEARKAFPQAWKEILAAGNCYALSQFTASVFHAMRGAEIGVRALCQDLKVTLRHPVEHSDWHELLKGIGGAIEKIELTVPRSAERQADLNFYSAAAAQFRFFKVGWRHDVAHAREWYTDNEAHQVLEHVRPFFETLSERLKEVV